MSSPASTSIEGRRSFGLTAILAIAGIALLSYVIVSGGYLVTVLGFAAIYTVFCTGLNFFMGYTGQASFGQSAFAAIGGYGSAILCTDHGWEPALALKLARRVYMISLGRIVAELPANEVKSHHELARFYLH